MSGACKSGASVRVGREMGEPRVNALPGMRASVVFDFRDSQSHGANKIIDEH